MTTYTEQDFANAEFARHPDGRIAARVDSGNLGWWAGGNGRAEPSWMDDDDMAEEGFVPVQEAADQPITLDALEAAWKNAEQAEWAEPGDVLIWHGSATEGYTVRRARSAHTIELNARILHRIRSTRPEGAERLEALLDDWDDLTWVGKPALLADWLAERGVRVVEGGK